MVTPVFETPLVQPRKELVSAMINLMKEGADFHLSLWEYSQSGSDTAERLRKDPASLQFYKVVGHLAKKDKLHQEVSAALAEALNGPDGLRELGPDEVCPSPADLPVVLRCMQSWHGELSWFQDSADLRSTHFKEALKTLRLKLQDLVTPYHEQESCWHSKLSADAALDTVLEQGQLESRFGCSVL